jgi:hypothetical protein
MKATIDTRYVFTTQFLGGAALLSRQAFSIEARPTDDLTERDRATHLSCVVSAVMQSVAALEADIWDICHYGPGHHLGSNGVDVAGREFLSPVADTIDREDVLSRYSLVLHLLRRPALDPGAQAWQEAALVVRLRNEITHYKSRWGIELDRSKLFSALQGKHSKPPPFVPKAGVNFFPLQCLSAERAAWSVESVVAFLSSYYVALGVESPVARHDPAAFVARP